MVWFYILCILYRATAIVESVDKLIWYLVRQRQTVVVLQELMDQTDDDKKYDKYYAHINRISKLVQSVKAEARDQQYSILRNNVYASSITVEQFNWSCDADASNGVEYRAHSDEKYYKLEMQGEENDDGDC